MFKRSLWFLATVLTALPFFAATSAAAASPSALPAPGTIAMVSTDTTGTAASDGDSSEVSVSRDGRYVAYSSVATNVIGIPTGGIAQVYVKDMLTGHVGLISQDRMSPSGAGNGPSWEPSISADGRFVAFTSYATNLDPLHRSNTHSQIYVRDLNPGGNVRLASVNSSLSGGGYGTSSSPAISADGTKLAFQSKASDLVPGAPSGYQIYVTDVAPSGSSTTAFVSLQDSGRYPMPDLAGDDAFDPTISGDGSLIGFASYATNLTGDSNAGGGSQVFVHSMATGSTRLVSAVPGKARAGNGSSLEPSISSDGRRMAFTSRASDLTGGAVSGNGLVDQIYVSDLTAGSAPATLVSLNRRGVAAGSGPSHDAAISSSGARIAFQSDATDLTPATAPNNNGQVYVRDLPTLMTTLVTTTHADKTIGGANQNAGPSVSGDGNSIGFSSKSTDLTELATDGVVSQVYLRRLAGPRVERIGGADRFAVSAAISADLFGPGVPVAYIASGAVFPDALSASAAAGAQGGPVLLASKDSISSAVTAELDRLKPKSIVLLGGLNTVSALVEAELKAIAPTTRIGGEDRYIVSAAIAAAAFPAPPAVAYIASGENFPDALSGSAIAGQQGAPVLLVQKDKVPDAIRTELKNLKASRLVVLGGTNTISAEVETALSAIAPTTRLTGADRYVVSATISHENVNPNTHTVYVASGAGFPDALSGSAAGAANVSPVLLVTKDTIPTAVADELDRIRPTRIVVLGGPNTIADTVLTSLDQYLRSEPV